MYALSCFKTEAPLPYVMPSNVAKATFTLSTLPSIGWVVMRLSSQ